MANIRNINNSASDLHDLLKHFTMISGHPVHGVAFDSSTTLSLFSINYPELSSQICYDRFACLSISAIRLFPEKVFIRKFPSNRVCHAKQLRGFI